MKISKAAWKRLERLEAQQSWRAGWAEEEPEELTPEQEEAWMRDFTEAFVQVFGGISEARGWGGPTAELAEDLAEWGYLEAIPSK